MLSCDRRLALGALLALGACGFRPAYAPGGRAAELDGRIVFPEPETRDMQLLVRQLEERLGTPRPGAPMQLKVSLSVDEIGLGTTQAGRTVRFHLVGRAAWTLVDAATGATLQDGVAESFTGYSGSGTTVATLAAERDARSRLMTILADRIADRLLLTGPAGET